MKIKHVDVIPVTIAGDDPEWSFALAKVPVTKGFIVKLSSDDGLVGLGFNHSSSHYGVSLGGLQDSLAAYTGMLIGRDPFDMEKIFSDLNRSLAKNNQAKAAIDIALHDLQAKALGVPLYALLGGRFRDQIPVIRILALKEPEKMAPIAVKLVEEGYRYLKVKLNGDVEKDIGRVKAVREAVGDTIHLTVDANQSYTPKTAIEAIQRMQKYGIDFCEQPVRADDWKGLAAVTHAVNCPIEAHESAETLEDIYNLAQNRVADRINLSIRHLGGLRQAKIAAAVCKLANVSLRVQATGSRILSAAFMHFVASTENVDYACELGEFTRLLEDPAEGLEVRAGMLNVPSVPGIGVSLRT